MIKARMYKKEDYEKIISFLREMYELNKNQNCWLSARWEYAQYFVNPLFVELGRRNWESLIRIWEENEKIVGIVHPEEDYNTFLQVRPGYRHIESEMIEWAENNISLSSEENSKKIVVWANDRDTFRGNLLMKLNYEKEDRYSSLNVQTLDKEYEIELPDGYVIRSMDEDIDLLKKYTVINRAFNPQKDDPVEVSESFVQMMKAPMYRCDLDIVCEYKDGSLAAACLIWYDEKNKIGMLEPVATHPNHHRKGLGKAVISEGLKRLKEIGGKYAYVDSYGDKMYNFYSSAGFMQYDKYIPWVKVLKSEG